MSRKPGGDRRPIAKKFADAAKTNEAVRLASEGKGVREIGATLGWSRSMAARAIQRSLASVKNAVARDVVAQELEYTAQMLEGLSEAGAFEGDPKAVMAACKVLERRANYLGLDEAAKTELTGKDGGAIEMIAGSQDELLARLSSLAARAAARIADSGSKPE